MSTKSKWFLGLAGAALLISLGRLIPGIAVTDGVGDFSVGLAAALMIGALITWKDRRAAR